MKKQCGNCKHWKNENDIQGTCDLTLRAIDGENVDSSDRKIDRQFDRELRGVTMECSAKVRDYSYDDRLDYYGLDPSELFSDIQIWFGKDFGCINWEVK